LLSSLQRPVYTTEPKAHVENKAGLPDHINLNIMSSKMDELRKWKNVNKEEGRTTEDGNELKRATDNAKKKYLESICDEIIEFQRT
jgi:hypothetical protein